MYLRMIILVAAFLAGPFGLSGAFASDPTVSNVRAEQRPGTKLVDVWYDLDAVADVSLAVTDGGQTVTVSSVSGNKFRVPAGTSNQVTWDAGADWNGQVSSSMVFSISAITPPPYLVIDLSGGPSASSYPVSYLNAIPPGGWTDEYKTTNLVLRRIPAGTFTMGSPSNELGRYSYEPQHEVTLTKDFYIGVFEVTQKQWERVMGTYPSYFTNVTYRDSRPVETVSYYDIRENPANSAISPNWPQSSQVHADSFMGKLRARTGLSTLDLPTESQWEYAGRAGTTTALNSGNNLTNTSADTSMDAVGRYYFNHPGGYSESRSVSTNGGTATVGSYQPNAWGLYDMHGNVYEWCLDWYGTYPGTVTDPAGAASGSNRVSRGGYWGYYAGSCRSANRNRLIPSSRNNGIGFRLATTLR